MTRKTSRKIAAQPVLTAGTFAQYVSDDTDHKRHEDRTASLAQTFAAEGLDELDTALPSLEDQPEPALELAQEIEDLVEYLIEDPVAEIAETPLANEATFREAMASFDEVAVQGMTTLITATIDARTAFETGKHGDGSNIQKTLRKVRKALMWKDTSRVMLAANIDPAFLNRTLHDGSRYNVYAVDKVADAVKGLADGIVGNAITRACMVSLFQMRKAGLPFTGEIAKACASDKVPVELVIRKHLLRHTVSASTAPTQASSTMQALETLGIVRREGAARNPTFHLTDSPITRRLEEVLFATAA